MKVCKFGGSSLSSAENIKKVKEIIEFDPERRIVVVSAPGKRFSDDVKITDMLIALSSAIRSGYPYEKDLSRISERFAELGQDLGLDFDIADVVSLDLKKRIAENSDNDQDLEEALKAAGEDLNARLIARYFSSAGLRSTYVSPGAAGLILEESCTGTAAREDCYEKLGKYLRSLDGILIFPGFFGLNSEGKIRTFSRGGSDITGSVLANAVDASIYENWTDVDNVFSANPQIVDNPAAINELSYGEMRELAYAGFSVIHEEAMTPTAKKGIPINIRNTGNPHASGTMIVGRRRSYDSVVTGVAGKSGFCILHLSQYLMNREVGFVYKVLKILNEFNIPFDHMPTGINSISLVMREEVFPAEKERRVLNKLRQELQIEEIKVEHNIAIVMIVGEAMAKTVGVTAKATGALSKAGVNLRMIIQGDSEISTIFAVDASFWRYAVKELYKEFFLR